MNTLLWLGLIVSLLGLGVIIGWQNAARLDGLVRRIRCRIACGDPS